MANIGRAPRQGGPPKPDSSRPRVRARTLAAAGVGLVLLLVWRGPGPERVFRLSVADPIPPSVRIIRASRGPFYGHEYWSHFRIGPADLRALLAVNGYAPVPHMDGSTDFSSLGPPAWWDPRTLGPGTLCYKCHDEEHAEEWLWTKTILVNAAGDEAYAVQVYPY